MKKQIKAQEPKTTYTLLIAKSKATPNLLINSKIVLGPALKAYYTKEN